MILKTERLTSLVMFSAATGLTWSVIGPVAGCIISPWWRRWGVSAIYQHLQANLSGLQRLCAAGADYRGTRMLVAPAHIQTLIHSTATSEGLMRSYEEANEHVIQEGRWPDNRAQRHKRTLDGSINLQPSNWGKQPSASLHRPSGVKGQTTSPCVSHVYQQNKGLYHHLNMET